MLNEKQVQTRMNRAYENYFGNSDEDEWYGSDDFKEWEFYRPSTGIYGKLVMNEAAKRIDVYEGKSRTDYRRVGNTW